MNETQAADDMPHRSKAEIEAALAAAKADGARETMDRLTAAIGSDDVRRDPRRLAAAIDMVLKIPDMSGESIASFVVSHITAADRQEVASQDYAARRAAMSVVWSRPTGGEDDRSTLDGSTGE